MKIRCSILTILISQFLILHLSQAQENNWPFSDILCGKDFDSATLTRSSLSNLKPEDKILPPLDSILIFCGVDSTNHERKIEVLHNGFSLGTRIQAIMFEALQTMTTSQIIKIGTQYLRSQRNLKNIKTRYLLLSLIGLENVTDPKIRSNYWTVTEKLLEEEVTTYEKLKARRVDAQSVVFMIGDGDGLIQVLETLQNKENDPSVKEVSMETISTVKELQDRLAN